MLLFVFLVSLLFWRDSLYSDSLFLHVKVFIWMFVSHLFISLQYNYRHMDGWFYHVYARHSLCPQMFRHLRDICHSQASWWPSSFLLLLFRAFAIFLKSQRIIYFIIHQVYVAAFSIGLGAVPWVVMSEVIIFLLRFSFTWSSPLGSHQVYLKGRTKTICFSFRFSQQGSKGEREA